MMLIICAIVYSLAVSSRLAHQNCSLFRLHTPNATQPSAHPLSFPLLLHRVDLLLEGREVVAHALRSGLECLDSQKIRVSGSCFSERRTGVKVRWTSSMQGSARLDRISSDAITHIDIVLEELIRRLVVLQDIVVAARAGERGAQEETEEPVPYHKYKR